MRYCLKQRYVPYAPWTAEHTKEQGTTDIRFLAVMSAAGRL